MQRDNENSRLHKSLGQCGAVA